MGRYIALLRGINVGGNNKISMIELKSELINAGFLNVVTYINSGNIIFDHDSNNIDSINTEITELILDIFKINIAVLIISADSFKLIAQKIPDTWQNNDQMKTDVLFLWSEINEPDVIQKLNFDPEIDDFLYIDGAVVWSVDRQLQMRSGLQNLIKSPLYKYITIRNCNTVRKINMLI